MTKDKFLLSIKQEATAIGWFSLATIIILWQLLLPGYVLTLDMIFTPTAHVFFEPGGFYNQLPLQYLILALSFMVPVWLIQKFILVGLFFSMGYLAYKFLPVPNSYGAKYWAGLFYMANPFVYERMLAGQWMILGAYALLPVLFASLVRAFRRDNFHDLFGLPTLLFLISIFSLHIFIMAAIVSLLYGVWQFGRISLKALIIKIIAITVMVSLMAGLYLAPGMLTADQSSLAIYDEADFQAFATATDPMLGTSLNVLTLYGFWGESMNWASYWLWPKDNFWFWSFSAVLLLAIIIFGLIKSFQADKRLFGFLLSLGFLALVFSVGIGDSVFKPINDWLFSHVWFWRGFRDTQKWSSWLALIYACFGGLGVAGLLSLANKLKEAKFKAIMVLLFFIPVLYTYTLWGGLSRQIKPIWYPEGWDQVKAVIDQDAGDYKVLFLPWHQYLSLEFNRNIIVQNPAKAFFGPKIVQGENVEIGEIYSQSGDLLTKEVEALILAKKGDQEAIVQSLKILNFRYIIYLSGFETIPGQIDFIPVESKTLENKGVYGGLTIYGVL